MKKISYIVLTFSVLFLVSSCNSDFFNQVPDDRLTLEQIFQRRELSEEYLANIYSYVPDESYRNKDVPWVCCDDVDVTYDRTGYYSYLVNLGQWNPTNDYYPFWEKYYEGIRSATYFMQHIEDNPDFTEVTNGDQLVRQYKAEAQFLRAFFYFNLLRQYGPVVLLNDEVIPGDLSSDNELMKLPQSPYDECVDYIVKELDLAAQDLPLHFTSQQAQNYGRATKAMCLAVKSRLLLYAASPQFNGNPMYSNFKNTKGEQLISQSYDANKWKDAADAAKEIIDLGIFSLYKKSNENGEFDPYLSCRDVLLDPWNSEVIFVRISNHLNWYERSITPRLASGYSAVGVTQQFVDAFYMENGKTIDDPNSGYIETGYSTTNTKYTKAGTYNMYVNREPRFYINVSYNGCLWINETEGEKVFETFYSGNSGEKGSWDFSRTGYVARKNVHPDSNPRISEYIERPYVLYRYAEVLLNYVEALNEYAPGNPDILTYLNDIRERAGIPGIETVESQDEMREIIRRERHVELALENLRYSDTRRWLIAAQTDEGPFYGMNVHADPPEFYKRNVFETRVFKKNYYLFPIPQTEIDLNENLVQNPGW